MRKLPSLQQHGSKINTLIDLMGHAGLDILAPSTAGPFAGGNGPAAAARIQCAPSGLDAVNPILAGPSQKPAQQLLPAPTAHERELRPPAAAAASEPPQASNNASRLMLGPCMSSHSLPSEQADTSSRSGSEPPFQKLLSASDQGTTGAAPAAELWLGTSRAPSQHYPDQPSSRMVADPPDTQQPEAQKQLLEFNPSLSATSTPSRPGCSPLDLQCEEYPLINRVTSHVRDDSSPFPGLRHFRHLWAFCICCPWSDPALIAVSPD